MDRIAIRFRAQRSTTPPRGHVNVGPTHTGADCGGDSATGHSSRSHLITPPVPLRSLLVLASSSPIVAGSLPILPSTSPPVVPRGTNPISLRFASPRALVRGIFFYLSRRPDLRAVREGGFRSDPGLNCRAGSRAVLVLPPSWIAPSSPPSRSVPGVAYPLPFHC
jgi:hypothetical protein